MILKFLSESYLSLRDKNKESRQILFDSSLQSIEIFKIFFYYSDTTSKGISTDTSL